MDWRRILLAGALGGALLFAGAGVAQAHDRDGCFERIRREEWRLEREIRRHGYYSRQAQRRRHELFHLRERCRFEEHRRFDRRHRRW